MFLVAFKNVVAGAYPTMAWVNVQCTVGDVRGVPTWCVCCTAGAGRGAGGRGAEEEPGPAGQTGEGAAAGAGELHHQICHTGAGIQLEERKKYLKINNNLYFTLLHTCKGFH